MPASTPRLFISALALAATTPAAFAGGYSEAVSGDLSNSGLTPTFVSVAAGSNVVSGATGNPGTGVDRDYFTFTVPAGYTLSALTAQPGTSVLGAVSFIGIQAGPQVTAPTGGPATLLLGWTHYSAADVSVNILPRMGTGAGAVGFSGALPAGSYSVWIQEFSAGTAPYAFDFAVTAVPEPATAALALMGMAGLLAYRRQRA